MPLPQVCPRCTQWIPRAMFHSTDSARENMVGMLACWYTPNLQSLLERLREMGDDRESAHRTRKEGKGQRMCQE